MAVMTMMAILMTMMRMLIPMMVMVMLMMTTAIFTTMFVTLYKPIVSFLLRIWFLNILMLLCLPISFQWNIILTLTRLYLLMVNKLFSNRQRFLNVCISHESIWRQTQVYKWYTSTWRIKRIFTYPHERWFRRMCFPHCKAYTEP